MPSYFFIGADERVWPDRRFKPDGEDQTVRPGDVVEADSNPDPLWFDEVGVNDGPVTPPSAPEPAAPVADEPAQEG